ncbi:MAG TPA: lyase, partial [Allosphingosinicella sp.]|nr:lyase [Allosphingosinicella sp.]
AQERVDTAEVRQALIVAAQDEEAIVRAEAISGLASRDRALALPFLRAELAGASVTMPLLEAAALVADASLADDLRAFCLQSGNRFLDELAAKALAACEAAGAATGA